MVPLAEGQGVAGVDRIAVGTVKPDGALSQIDMPALVPVMRGALLVPACPW